MDNLLESETLSWMFQIMLQMLVGIGELLFAGILYILEVYVYYLQFHNVFLKK